MVQEGVQVCTWRRLASLTTSSACWIECFYSTTLGADSSTKDTNSTGEGLSLEQLVWVWERPFSSTDTAEGGCPDTSGQTPSPPPLGGY